MILHCCAEWLPLTQNWMYTQVHHLQKLGEEVHVVCERLNNTERFRVEGLHSMSTEPKIYQIMSRTLRKIGMTKHLLHTKKNINRLQPAIVHSHFGHYAWEVMDVVKKVGSKHVVTFYGWDVNGLVYENPKWEDRYKDLFNTVDGILCEGPFMAESIERLGCPRELIHVCHLGVEIDEIKFKPRKWEAGTPLRILIAASFREKKGIPVAIRALDMLAGEYDIHLSIIGDAGTDQHSQTEKKRILAEVEKCSFKKNTQFLGYKSHEELLNEAYRHHLFLHPSVTASNGDTEGGAPVVIIEMLASGLPVVASMHCDIPEVVGPEFKSYLSSENSHLNLADMIQGLLNNSKEWDGMLLKTRTYIAEEFNGAVQAKKLINIYSNL